MKYIISYKLFEGKNIGILYHFTSIENLMEIINNNELIGGLDRDSDISLTRDKNFIDTSGAAGLGCNSECRIVIDGNKLSNNYKIKPHNAFSDGDVFDDSVMSVAARPFRSLGWFNNKEFIVGPESEERVLTTVIKNIKNYIIKVDFIFGEKNNIFRGSGPTEEELDVLRQNKIKFNLIC
jgi:hypothetical protein